MKKLAILGTIGGAALLTAVPFSLQWSPKYVALSLDSAEARVGRPLTPLSVAGVQRRANRRAVYAGAAGYGYGSYSGYGYPAYSSGYSYPAYNYSGYGYPAYSYSYNYPGYSYPAYGGYRVARRVAIHRARHW